MASSSVTRVGSLDIQFGPNWDAVKANQLVQTTVQVISQVNALTQNLAALTTQVNQGSSKVAAHALVGAASPHTVSGLTAGQVLVATSPTSVAFRTLALQDLAQTDPASIEDASQGDVLTFTDGFWSAAGISPFGLGDPGNFAVIQWNNTAEAFAWALPAANLAITPGGIAVIPGQISHSDLANLYYVSDGAGPLANDHPQYGLLAGTQTWSGLNTFSGMVALDGGLSLEGPVSITDGTTGASLTLAGLEAPFIMTDTDPQVVNEASWSQVADVGQLIFSSLNDDGSAGENWLTATRIGEIVDQVNVSSNSFTWNGDQVLTASSIAPGANVYLTMNAAGQVVFNAATGSGGGSVSPANPTALVGTSVVNGSAATFMRSDAAPALDTTINPTWTGVQLFSGAIQRSPTVTGTSLGTDSGFSALSMNYLGGATDTKIVEIINEGSNFAFGFVNDAITVLASWLTVGRSGTNDTGIFTAGATGSGQGQGTINTKGLYVNGVSVGTGLANPSGLIGLTAVNGTATTGVRSDATHALDVNIAPSWNGIHTFNNIIVLANEITGQSNAGTIGFFANNTSLVVGAFIQLVGSTASSQPGALILGTNSAQQVVLTSSAVTFNEAATFLVSTTHQGSTTTPSLVFKATSGATDAKTWDFYADSSGNLNGRAVNDAFSAATSWLQVTRAGDVPQIIDLVAPTTQVQTLSLDGNIVGASNSFAYTITAAPSATFSSSGYIQLFGSTSGSPYLVNLSSNGVNLQLLPTGVTITGGNLTGVGATFSATVNINLAAGGNLVAMSVPSGTQGNWISVSQTSVASWVHYTPASNTDYRIFDGTKDTFVFLHGGGVIANATGGATVALQANGSANGYAALILGGGSTGTSLGLIVRAGTNSADVAFAVQTLASANILVLSGDAKAKFSNTLGVFGNTGPTQVTGAGTPSGGSLIANFPGATASLTQCSQAISFLIGTLKQIGYYAT